MNKSIAKQAGELTRLWGGFRAARVVLTANNYNIFEHLKAARTAGELADILETDFRATEILLDAVASLGLLTKHGKRYRLAAASRQFLLKESPLYQGDALRHADALWKAWSGLDDVVKTGKPNRSKDRDHESFIRAMHNNAIFRAPAVIKALDLRGVRTALDLGGGPGTYSIELAKRGIAVTLFDLPNTLEIAEPLLRKSGTQMVELRGGDFNTDPLGKDYDLVFISQVFHSYSKADNCTLLERSRRALQPRGRIAIHEFLIERNRAYPPSGALFSVNMLVNTSAGRCYTPQEMKEWLAETGFGAIREKPINDTVLVTGRKL